MDFAPYQDTSPEASRALSPPPLRSLSRSPTPKPPPQNRNTNAFAAPILPAPNYFSSDDRREASFHGEDFENRRLHVNLLETTLPIRLDYEAALAYLVLPPAAGVFLLVMEHKSDYVRYGRSSPVDSRFFGRLSWHPREKSISFGHGIRELICRGTDSMPGNRVCCSPPYLLAITDQGRPILG